MKKLFIVLAVASLGFVACNNDSDKGTGTDTTQTTTPTDTMPKVDTTPKVDTMPKVDSPAAAPAK